VRDVTESIAGKAGHRLLAVDDNVESAELVGRIARKCGYDVRVASTAGSVRRELVDWRPSVLTLDLCMPDGDAIDLLPLLQEANFDGRVVIVSGHDDWLRKSASKLAAARGLDSAGDLPLPLDLAKFRQLLLAL
jgi:two-component system chemotaxis response regulator CheY